ncbi:unnamed protein product [Meloidogyne enterolobii]|uniref:Uncharacterized protein n=1 Tax=Meloidogyne enterolobii TaxID=390850 RepID=A0ACB1AHM8_MELEN
MIFPIIFYLISEIFLYSSCSTSLNIPHLLSINNNFKNNFEGEGGINKNKKIIFNNKKNNFKTNKNLKNLNLAAKIGVIEGGKIIMGEGGKEKKFLGGKKILFENLLIKNMHERMNNDEILNKNLSEGESLILTKFEIENAKMVAKLIFEAEAVEKEDLILLGGELAFALFVGERLKSGENLIKNFEKIIEVI